MDIEDPTNDLDEDGARQLLRGGLGNELLRAAANYVAPIFWGDPSSDEQVIENNGSVFFVDCGHGAFAVTAEHVIAGYEEAQRADASMRCQIANHVFDPSDRIISRSVELDLITMAVTEEDVEAVDKWIYTRPPTMWPPPPPDEGKGVFFAGFPGVYRERLGDDWLFGVFAGLGVASTVTGAQIAYNFDRLAWDDIWELGIPPEHVDLGGLSGAPLLAVDLTRMAAGGSDLGTQRKPRASRCRTYRPASR